MTVRAEDRQAVQRARSLWLQYGGGVPVDIGHIASAFGFTFEYRRAPLSFRGMLLMDLKHIVINADLPACQQRYVIAHELGHWLVVTEQLPVRPTRLERVCQLFAAHLLMPPDRVAADAHAAYGRADLLDGLAAAYLVTPTAMRIQLQQLGLLPGGAGHTLEQDIAAAAWYDPPLTVDLHTAEDPVALVPMWEVEVDALYRRRDP